MYKEEYTRWVNEDLIDFDLGKELRDIADDEDAIKERFAVSLKFGTAGLHLHVQLSLSAPGVLILAESSACKRS